MPPLLALLLELTQLPPHPLRDRDPRHLETAFTGLPTDVGEAQKVERLRLAESPLLPLLGGEPPELDQPCLPGLQLQLEHGESLAQVRQELLSFFFVLEAHDEVVGVAHDDHVTPRLPLPPLVGPLVEDVVQVDVREQ